MTQSGLGLPERDYYFSKDQRFVEIRGAYEKHIDNVFKLAGRKDSAAVAKELMAFETRLAKASWPAVKMRDIEALYNPVTVEDAEKATPGIDWSTWLTRDDVAGLGPAGADAEGLLPGSRQGAQRRAARDVEGLPRRCARSTRIRPT